MREVHVRQAKNLFFSNNNVYWVFSFQQRGKVQTIQAIQGTKHITFPSGVGHLV